MNTDMAIKAFSQSEKVKAGLIWAAQVIDMLPGLPAGERMGGEKVVAALLNMIAHEISLASVIVGDEGWNEIIPHIEMALTMINSGVSQEATIHISKALSMVTNTAQQTMSFLIEKGLVT